MRMTPCVHVFLSLSALLVACGSDAPATDSGDASAADGGGGRGGGAGAPAADGSSGGHAGMGETGGSGGSGGSGEAGAGTGGDAGSSETGGGAGAQGTGGAAGSGGGAGAQGTGGAAGSGGGAGAADAGAPLDGGGTDAPHDAPAGVLSFTYDFATGAHGWIPGFADYGVVQTPEFMEIEAKIAPLPAELGSATGFMIQGNNHSDDLFMFFERPLGPSDGIVANRSYQAAYTVVFGSNAQSGCFGIGGSPDSLWLKVGAASIEPKPIVSSDQYVMNLDKGAQSNGGPAASVAGNIANGQDCDGSPTYVSLTKKHVHNPYIKADSSGRLWLLVGTDSGFEGLSRLYYQRIEVTLTPAP